MFLINLVEIPSRSEESNKSCSQEVKNIRLQERSPDFWNILINTEIS